ncbi:hypothetical protein R6Q59_019937 [Mikania micrantha]
MKACRFVPWQGLAAMVSWNKVGAWLQVRSPQGVCGYVWGSRNYASTLFITTAKVNILHIAESEIIDFVSASTNASTFSQFMKDLA